MCKDTLKERRNSLVFQKKKKVYGASKLHMTMITFFQPSSLTIVVKGKIITLHYFGGCLNTKKHGDIDMIRHNTDTGFLLEESRIYSYVWGFIEYFINVYSSTHKQ